MYAATGRGEYSPHMRLNLNDNLLSMTALAPGTDTAAPETSPAAATNALNLALTSLLKIHTHYWSHLAQHTQLREEGGTAASDEIRRQIDQCTLIPINHDSYRAWIIITCAGWCHLWEICRNNFYLQCNGEERILRRCIIYIIAWPRWRYLATVRPPCWQRNDLLM